MKFHFSTENFADVEKSDAELEVICQTNFSNWNQVMA